jgi:hypothetical protein
VNDSLDVRITLLKYEVYQEDYLDFEITIENKDTTNKDVNLEYWISNEQTWYHNSEKVFVPALSNKTLLETVYIPSVQPLGTYYLSINLTYDSTKILMEKNVSFSVISKTAGSTTPPTLPPQEISTYGIEIINYPKEIVTESGWTKQSVVEVKNSGKEDLHNISLMIKGIPLGWFEIDPTHIDSLAKNGNFTFSIKFMVPNDTESRKYAGSIITEADEAKDEKSFLFVVFTTRAELITYEIERLNTTLKEFEFEVESTRQLGRYVDDVLELIKKIREQIKLAKTDLSQNKYDSSLNYISNGWNLLTKARNLLASAPLIKRAPIPTLPNWVIPLTIILSSITVILFIFWKKEKRRLKVIFDFKFPEAKTVAGIVKTEKEKKVLKKKEKIARVLKLVKEEYEEGLISKRAYQELKEICKKKSERLR